MKVPNLSPLKLFAPASPQPALAPAGAGGNMMFARGGDDDGYDYPDQGTEADQQTSRTRRVVRDDSGRSRSSGDGGGRQRSIQFQPEERYWTDYLRIALPIIGLLLMVGLFWYWVEMLIDDPSTTDEPVSTVTTEGQPELASGGSTPAPTPPDVVNDGQAPAAGATQPPAEETPFNEENEPEETPPPEGADEGAGFAAGDTAIITEDGVNMRQQPTTAEENVVAELDTNTVVEIQSGPTEADEFNWWEIVVEDTGESGWVAEDFLEPAE